MNRASGLFLHPTSFPSQFGIGDLGDAAFEWIDLLVKMRQSYWQVCPLGPTGYGDSPYASLCSFAGNTLLISPLKLLQMGLLTSDDIAEIKLLPGTKIDYGTVIEKKEIVYRKAYARFEDSIDFKAFCDNEHYWLENYALFKVIKDQNSGLPWHLWPAEARLRFPSFLENIKGSQWREVRYQKFLQFMFHIQWMELKSYANINGIRIIGDLPIYIAYDSSDTWASPELFELDEEGKQVRVAGVPPDYFSETGQLWGNPLYKWDHMRQNGYSWWIRRFKKTLELVDLIRLDHFRGFESYWAIPASSKTAVKGEWVKGPGIDLFNAVKHALGNLPVIAEDLGEITSNVEELRMQAGLPGMKILQFAFDGNPLNPYLPYNINPESITYTGTHDNDTSYGWFSKLPEKDKTLVCNFLGCDEKSFIEHFLRLAFGSSSKICIIPFQDVLGLDSNHRMNTPGKESGNWQWRYTKDLVSKEKIKLIAELTSVYGRANIWKVN